jgi:peptidoglycan/xylan/chitin deacetylase (PgdA/CDA1 family)
MLHLLVGIDTEGDNQWAAEARRHPTFENIYALPRLHAHLARHGVRPTYFITYPVATDRRSADLLRGLLEQGGCEIGAHHHAWETPPASADDIDRHTYALDLSPDRFDQQLEALTNGIAQAVGRTPVSYRSGRFGFSASHVSSLERAGYLVESSIAPLFYEGHKGGPDFVAAPIEPYFLAYDSATRPGTSRLLEVPVSAALDRPVPRLLAHAWARAPHNYQVKRWLRRLRLVKLVWLRPSYSSLDEMIALAKRLQRARVPVLNLIFHSSEAIPGGSPYNRTAEDVDRFLATLDRFFEHVIGRLAAVPVTFAGFRARWIGPGGVAVRG